MRPFTDGSIQMQEAVAHFIATYGVDVRNVGNKSDTALEDDSYRAGSASASALPSSRLVNVLVTGKEIPSKAKRAPDTWPLMLNARAVI